MEKGNDVWAYNLGSYLISNFLKAWRSATMNPDSYNCKDITEGCIRLKNTDMRELKENYIRNFSSMKVLISIRK